MCVLFIIFVWFLKKKNQVLKYFFYFQIDVYFYFYKLGGDTKIFPNLLFILFLEIFFFKVCGVPLLKLIKCETRV
jgi:hypothetical protein